MYFVSLSFRKVQIYIQVWAFRNLDFKLHHKNALNWLRRVWYQTCWIKVLKLRDAIKYCKIFSATQFWNSSIMLCNHILKRVMYFKAIWKWAHSLKNNQFNWVNWIVLKESTDSGLKTPFSPPFLLFSYHPWK